MSNAERRSITRLAVRTGVTVGVMMAYVTGERTPAGWVCAHINQEFGDDWKERFSEEST